MWPTRGPAPFNPSIVNLDMSIASFDHAAGMQYPSSMLAAGAPCLNLCWFLYVPHKRLRQNKKRNSLTKKRGGTIAQSSGVPMQPPDPQPIPRFQSRPACAPAPGPSLTTSSSLRRPSVVSLYAEVACTCLSQVHARVCPDPLSQDPRSIRVR
jgi:hypothetical protein